NARRLGLAKTHVKPHLAVGEVAAGQTGVPHRREEPASYRPTATARKHGPLRGPAGRQIRNSGRAMPSLRHASGDTSSSRLTRFSHSVCRSARSQSSSGSAQLGGLRPFGGTRASGEVAFFYRAIEQIG